MAEIVFGLGTSHGPLLVTPPGEWDLRANVDRKNKALAFRDKTLDFEQLYELRKAEHFEKQNTLEVREEHFLRCHKALEELSRRAKAAGADVMLIVGDDQEEWFRSDVQPSFAIYFGDEVPNRPLTEPERRVKIDTGNKYSMEVYFPKQRKVYPGQPDLAKHLILQSIEDEFDMTSCEVPPRDGDMIRPLGHAYGFIYRRLLDDLPLPLVPILVNTYFPPNQPTPKRCFELGRSIGRAIKSWDGNKKVAVAASGGMSHFVVDEEFDNRVLDAMKARDVKTLTSEPQVNFRSGTSETKNWLVVAGMVAETDLEMDLIDYVPCYRSEAGTGSGMAFATWQ